MQMQGIYDVKSNINHMNFSYNNNYNDIDNNNSNTLLPSTNNTGTNSFYKPKFNEYSGNNNSVMKNNYDYNSKLDSNSTGYYKDKMNSTITRNNTNYIYDSTHNKNLNSVNNNTINTHSIYDLNNNSVDNKTLIRSKLNNDNYNISSNSSHNAKTNQMNKSQSMRDIRENKVYDYNPNINNTIINNSHINAETKPYNFTINSQQPYSSKQESKQLNNSNNLNANQEAPLTSFLPKPSDSIETLTNKNFTLINKYTTLLSKHNTFVSNQQEIADQTNKENRKQREELLKQLEDITKTNEFLSEFYNNHSTGKELLQLRELVSSYNESTKTMIETFLNIFKIIYNIIAERDFKTKAFYYIKDLMLDALGNYRYIAREFKYDSFFEDFEKIFFNYEFIKSLKYSTLHTSISFSKMSGNNNSNNSNNRRSNTHNNSSKGNYDIRKENCNSNNIINYGNFELEERKDKSSFYNGIRCNYPKSKKNYNAYDEDHNNSNNNTTSFNDRMYPKANDDINRALSFERRIKYSEDLINSNNLNNSVNKGYGNSDINNKTIKGVNIKNINNIKRLVRNNSTFELGNSNNNSNPFINNINELKNDDKYNKEDVLFYSSGINNENDKKDEDGNEENEIEKDNIQVAKEENLHNDTRDKGDNDENINNDNTNIFSNNNNINNDVNYHNERLDINEGNNKIVRNIDDNIKIENNYNENEKNIIIENNLNSNNHEINNEANIKSNDKNENQFICNDEEADDNNKKRFSISEAIRNTDNDNNSKNINSNSNSNKVSNIVKENAYYHKINNDPNNKNNTENSVSNNTNNNNIEDIKERNTLTITNTPTKLVRNISNYDFINNDNNNDIDVNERKYNNKEELDLLTRSRMVLSNERKLDHEDNNINNLSNNRYPNLYLNDIPNNKSTITLNNNNIDNNNNVNDNYLNNPNTSNNIRNEAFNGDYNEDNAYKNNEENNNNNMKVNSNSNVNNPLTIVSPILSSSKNPYYANRDLNFEDTMSITNQTNTNFRDFFCSNSEIDVTTRKNMHRNKSSKRVVSDNNNSYNNIKSNSNVNVNKTRFNLELDQHNLKKENNNNNNFYENENKQTFRENAYDIDNGNAYDKDKNENNDYRKPNLTEDSLMKGLSLNFKYNADITEESLSNKNIYNKNDNNNNYNNKINNKTAIYQESETITKR